MRCFSVPSYNYTDHKKVHKTCLHSVSPAFEMQDLQNLNQAREAKIDNGFKELA